ncbi:MAG: AAA family ATPase [Chloroflexota bacterium]|nr:AAA family ATPase [Chloroflexota bacterium]
MAAQGSATPAVVSSGPATIVIVSQDPEVHGVWVALREEGISAQLATCLEEAAELVDAAQQCLLVLDADIADKDVRALHEQAHAGLDRPILWVLSEPGALEQAGSCNSRLEERIGKPVSGAVLALRIKALALQAGLELPRPTGPSSGASARPSDARGSLIAVYGAKGGAGKSTIAVNLAVCLARSFQRKVLLADVDLWYGDVGVLLDVRSDKSLFDVCSGKEIDLFGLPRAVVPHALGPSLLLRPHDPRQVENVNTALVGQSLRTYCALYDYVLADTGPTLEDINLQVLDVADEILLVTTPELASIHNCARFLALAQTLGHFDKVRLVVNRANSGVDVDALQETLKVPVYSRLVSSGKLVVDAANQGTSVFTIDPGEQDQFTRDVVALAERLVGQPRTPARAVPKARPARRLWPRFLFRAAA